MHSYSHTIVWFSARESIPKKDRVLIATLNISESYNNRAGLICTDSLIGCSSIGERAFFYDLDEAAQTMEKNRIERYTLNELLDPDILPKYHERMA